MRKSVEAGSHDCWHLEQQLMCVDVAAVSCTNVNEECHPCVWRRGSAGDGCIDALLV